jgi:hypothetical protein
MAKRLFDRSVPWVVKPRTDLALGLSLSIFLTTLYSFDFHIISLTEMRLNKSFPVSTFSPEMPCCQEFATENYVMEKF